MWANFPGTLLAVTTTMHHAINAIWEAGVQIHALPSALDAGE